MSIKTENKKRAIYKRENILFWMEHDDAKWRNTLSGPSYELVTAATRKGQMLKGEDGKDYKLFSDYSVKESLNEHDAKPFKYSEYTETIRLMPKNYCCLNFINNRWILDFDYAISTDILHQVIDCMKSKDLIGIKDGAKVANYLSEKVVVC